MVLMVEVRSSSQPPRRGLKRWQRLALVVAGVVMAGGLVGMLAGGEEASSAPAARPFSADRLDGAKGFLPAERPSQLPGDDANAAGPAGQNGAAPRQADSGRAAPATPPWARGLFQAGFGFAAGFAIAFALRVVFRLALVFLGLWVLSLVAMQQAGFLAVNWEALAGGYDSLAGLLAGQFESLQAFLTGVFPASAAGLAGLGTGFARG